MKYKVGDKVRVRKDLMYADEYGGYIFLADMYGYGGEVVTIAAVHPDHYHIKEDHEIRLWTDEMFEPACAEKIVITTDGVTTIARKYDGKKLVKEAKAVCSKDDTFNFDVGAKLAMERLMKEDKPKLYSGKVVCVDNKGNELCYTKGKIYEFKDGKGRDDLGLIIGGYDISSFKDLQDACFVKWLEVVE